MIALLLASTLAVAPLATDALASDAGFSLPSGRLGCELQDTSVRCDVRGATFKALPRPASCPLVWGDALGVKATGRAFFVCHGDTVLGAARPVLAYGARWRRGGFTCLSSPAGVRCTNGAGHGFELARSRYRLF